MNDPLNGFSKKQLKLGFRNYSNTMWSLWTKEWLIKTDLKK
jgi:hypothetical protein